MENNALDQLFQNGLAFDSNATYASKEQRDRQWLTVIARLRNERPTRKFIWWIPAGLFVGLLSFFFIWNQIDSSNQLATSELINNQTNEQESALIQTPVDQAIENTKRIIDPTTNTSSKQNPSNQNNQHEPLKSTPLIAEKEQKIKAEKITNGQSLSNQTVIQGRDKKDQDSVDNNQQLMNGQNASAYSNNEIQIVDRSGYSSGSYSEKTNIGYGESISQNNPVSKNDPSNVVSDDANSNGSTLNSRNIDDPIFPIDHFALPLLQQFPKKGKISIYGSIPYKTLYPDIVRIQDQKRIKPWSLSAGIDFPIHAKQSDIQKTGYQIAFQLKYQFATRWAVYMNYDQQDIARTFIPAPHNYNLPFTSTLYTDQDPKYSFVKYREQGLDIGLEYKLWELGPWNLCLLGDYGIDRQGNFTGISAYEGVYQEEEESYSFSPKLIAARQFHVGGSIGYRVKQSISIVGRYRRSIYLGNSINWTLNNRVFIGMQYKF